MAALLLNCSRIVFRSRIALIALFGVIVVVVVVVVVIVVRVRMLGD
jgi:hypothetical protein